jgi:hypothetical protein
LIASSALAFHLSVVDTMIRSVNPSFPDADRKESISGLLIVESAAKNLHWIATSPPVTASAATRSMPVSGRPPRPGHSLHRQTPENCSA